MYFFCSLWIHVQKSGVKSFCTIFFTVFFQLFSVCTVFRIFRKINIIQKSLNIKSGSTYYDRNMSVGINLLHGLLGHLLKFYNMKFFFRIKFIDQIMRNSFHFFRADLGRTNIHVFINLHGIC